jgi:ABC-type nickel/cobalt efflux system permease component RcnA
MPFAVLRTCLRSAATILLALALAFAPRFAGIAHDPLSLAMAEQARHAGLADSGDVDHHHEHDHGEAGERHAGHLHGHDPSDHTHDTGQAVPFLMAAGVRLDATLISAGSPGHDDGERERLERPPRASA